MSAAPARPQVDDAIAPRPQVIPDAGKIERPYAEDPERPGTDKDEGASHPLEAAKQAAGGYGTRIKDKAAEAKDSLTGQDNGKVVERTVHERLE